MSNTNSKELGRQYIEVIWNQADLSRLEEFTAVAQNCNSKNRDC